MSIYRPTLGTLIKPEFIRMPDGDRHFDGLVWVCYRTGSNSSAIFAYDGTLRVSRNNGRLTFSSYRVTTSSPLGWVLIRRNHRTEQGACRTAALYRGTP